MLHILTDHPRDDCVCRVVAPTSFAYGNSIDASRFVQLEEMECSFQPLNLTFQVRPPHRGFPLSAHAPLAWSHHVFFLFLMDLQAINKGPSRLLGSTVDIRIPNRLSGSGADMFHVIETQVDASSSPAGLFMSLRSVFISHTLPISALLPTARSAM